MTATGPGGPTGLPRRRFLRHLGSAAAGAVAAGGSAAVLLGGDPAPAGSPPARAGGGIDPHGEHQAGVTAASPPVSELVALDLVPGVDRDALGRLLRTWTDDIEALALGRPTPADTARELASERAAITVTVGLGPGAFRGDRATLRPAGLVDVPSMRHDRLQERWSAGDVVVVVGGAEGTSVAHAVRRLVADAAPFAGLRWRQPGFWNGTGEGGRPMTGRNLFGQVDGTGNPRIGTPLFDETVWIRSGRWAGGSTLVLRRIRMDLDRWDDLTRDEQERSLGRRLDDGAPLTGGGEHTALDLAAHRHGRLVVPPDAHSRRAHPSTSGGARIFRKGANYTHESREGPGVAIESGLLFQSYQADIGAQYVPVQQALDESDALNEWTTAIGSASFATLPGFDAGGWLGQSVLG